MASTTTLFVQICRGTESGVSIFYGLLQNVADATEKAAVVRDTSKALICATYVVAY